jgi:prepilin peptidase CpaA
MLTGVALFVVWAAMVAIWDCRTRRIPNALALVGLIAALGCALAHVNPFGVVLSQAVEGFAWGLLALSPFFVLRVMGAADVKVFAVLGAWCGPSALLGLWVAASIAAGLHALVLLITARTPVALWRGGQPTFAVGARRATPYAALLAGAATVFLFSHLASGATR